MRIFVVLVCSFALAYVAGAQPPPEKKGQGKKKGAPAGQVSQPHGRAMSNPAQGGKPTGAGKPMTTGKPTTRGKPMEAGKPTGMGTATTQTTSKLAKVGKAT